MPTADWRESVKQRLLNLSAVRSETFNVLLMRYGVERLLYRMMRSPHADAFVLKGAMLFAIWADKPHRRPRTWTCSGSAVHRPNAWNGSSARSAPPRSSLTGWRSTRCR